MTETPSFVFVVDDDPAVREALDSLVRSVGFRVRTFRLAHDFLHSEIPDVPACLVLDIRMPGLSGLDLQRELLKANIRIPIIFITGHGDISTSVRAMKAGAVEFLTKPFRDEDLLDAIRHAIERDRVARQQRRELDGVRERLNSLTQRERQVLDLVVSGLLNKQVAGKLGTSEVTVKLHRARVMRKMRAKSLAALLRMVEKLEISRRRTE